jgi:2-polyprenyl-3-methyl-5-hydroxy-6-metoxy-1,4-benzoquinol methylase
MVNKKSLVTANYGNLQKYQCKNILVKKLLNRFLNNLYDIVSSIKVENVLDVGCGEGFVINYLKARDVNLKFEGVDINEKAINMARQMNPGVNFKIENIYDLQYEDNSFDLVMAIELLEHLQSPEKALLEIKKVSKKFCIFSVPREPYFRISNFMRGKHILRWGNDPEHLCNWTKGQFVKVIKRYFKVTKVKNPFPWTMVLCCK